MMQTYKLEGGGGGGGGGWSCRPSGSCQELSEDGIQSRWPGEALGLPAVASLTPAETIHLVWRGPPPRVEADRNLSGPGKGQECTSVCTGHAPPAHSEMGAREKAHTAAARPGPPPPGCVCFCSTGAVSRQSAAQSAHMNHSPADGSRKQK